MTIGVIGGGLMGTALAYFLTKAGEKVVLLEQDSALGGLNGEIRFSDSLSVSSFQHAILPDDEATQDLCAELGLAGDLIFSEVRTGFLDNGRSYPMSDIWDFLTFSPLRLVDRIRLGQTILHARNTRDQQELDSIPVRDWLIQYSGLQAFERLWQPLLEAKFDGEYETIPATYIWTWLNRMSGIRRGPQLKGYVGYLREGHISLVRALGKAFVEAGGEIKIDMRVREIELADGKCQRVRTHSGNMEFDAVIAAVATPAFTRLIPGADTNYLNTLKESKYLGLICPLLVLNTSLSPYWTLNITDTNSPFASIIETQHPEHSRYRIVYLPKYTAPQSDWMGVTDVEIREAWLSHLKQLFPDFRENHVEYFAVSRSRYVEPVYSVKAPQVIADLQTPYSNLYLANTSQAYPRLPTSETVITHARAVAQKIRQNQFTSNRMVV
jgi:protoporphyrinogen oxidase